MDAVSKCAPQEALRNLDRAYANYFRRVNEKRAGKQIKVGFPRFKSKQNGLGSFRLTGAIHIFEKAIQLPRLGVLRLQERGYLPTAGAHVLSATVSARAGRWFVAVPVELELLAPQPTKQAAAGVDLGILRMATVSDGNGFDNPRTLQQGLTKLKRLQRRVARRKPGSANRQQAVQQWSRAHYHVANIRKNALHQATIWLAQTKSASVLADLHVSGLLKNHHLAQAMADVGLSEFRRQMSYQGAWYGCAGLIADRD